VAEAILQKIDNNNEDYKVIKQIYDNIVAHKGKLDFIIMAFLQLIILERKKIQTESFYEPWNNPPQFSLVVAEDAGKRFVLGILNLYFYSLM
jgi:hypothetical protein